MSQIRDKSKKEKLREEKIRKKQEEHNFLLQFIDVYRALPALWEVTNPDYTNREKKDNCYDTLFEKYREYYPESNKVIMKNKINTLRTNFRTELKKVRAKRSTMGENAAYVSDKWFFNALMFLKDHEDPSAHVSVIIEHPPPVSETSGVSSNNENTEDQNENTRSDEDENNVKIETGTAFSSKRNSTAGGNVLSRRKTRKPASSPTISAKLLRLAVDKLSAVEQRSSNSLPTEQDVFFYIGQTWARKLARLPRDQSRIAEKAINDILYEAEEGNLSRNSIYINSPPIYPMDT